MSERLQVQPQAQQSSNPPARTERIRARQARRRALHGVRIAAAVVAVLLSAALAVAVVTFHIGVRPVLTGSMRPDYGPGAVIFTRQVPTSTLKPGMIVLIIPPGESVPYAHRIATVTGTANAPVITTKGDANKAVDPWHAKITAPSVSVVIGSLPGIGRLLVGIRGAGQILLALLGGILVTWAGTRWLFGSSSSSRPAGRRATAGGA